ncbi:hypothetical protein OB03_12145 [Brevundimonas sp. GN22]
MESSHLSDVALFMGLKLYEWMTLLGIIAGPICAVLITLWVDRRRRKSDARTQILRMILTTRRLPSDPAYVMAINLIEVEFNDCPTVMKARSEYLELAVREVSESGKKDHEQRMVAKQATMIVEMMKAIGLKASESEILTDAYVSKGFIFRDDLYLDSLRAMRDIAEALKVSNFLVARSMGIGDESAKDALNALPNEGVRE